jgi:hypothetical protein
MSDQMFSFNPSSTKYADMNSGSTQATKTFSVQEEEMQSAILNLRERLTTLEQSCASTATTCCAPPTCCSSCDRVTALEARLAALEAVQSVPAPAPTKLRIVSLNYDTFGPDSILNEQGPYRVALSHGSDAIVKVSSSENLVRFCADWTAPTGTVIKVICDAPKLRFEGEGWTVLYEISQGEGYTFVKEEDGWKGYAGILMI